jgi:amino acid transporter
VVNGILIQIILASRVLYGMSRRKWLPAVFGRVNARTRTPLFATALVVGAVLGLGLAFPMEKLAQATTLATLVVFTLINASPVRPKRLGPTPPGAPAMPVWVPATGFVVSLASQSSKSPT